MWPEAFQEESGYTLVETLVAMALFLSVLIPLGVCIGTLLLDKDAEKTHQALLIAENAMGKAVHERVIEIQQFDLEGGFRVQREVSETAQTKEIEILVTQQKKPGKILVRLHKSLVREQ
jgi:type II secretory pathway pseudopilin PulG